MRTWYAKPDYNKAFRANYFGNVQHRHPFLKHDETSSEGSYKMRGVDHMSTTSERTSAGSSVRVMSTTTAGDENSLDPTKPPGTFVHEYPTTFVQSGGSQMLQPVMHRPYHSLYWSVAPSPIGVPSVSCAPVSSQPVPKGVQQSQKFQHAFAYSIPQCQQTGQNDANTRYLPASGPWMIAPATFTQKDNLNAKKASVVPNPFSTPIVSSFGSPGNVSNSTFINTPLISSASCTPIACPMMYPDTPPRLDLLKQQVHSSVYPQRMSCNINVVPAAFSAGKLGQVLRNSSSQRLNNRETPRRIVSHKRVNKIKNTGTVSEEEDLWKGNLDYEQYQFNGGSNLFITWSGSKAALVEKLRTFNLEVREVLRTIDFNICNVIFQSHPIARKAFTMQQRIRLRIVPPKLSDRIWFRNPSPTFLVKFETKCRLIVRRGKAECHDIVGELLKGCMITADQLKGNRIRVKCCEGSFMFPGGNVVEMKGVQNNSDKSSSLGWVSYRCKHTNESFVVRRSWNKLGDYLYRE